MVFVSEEANPETVVPPGNSEPPRAPGASRWSSGTALAAATSVTNSGAPEGNEVPENSETPGGTLNPRPWKLNPKPSTLNPNS